MARDDDAIRLELKTPITLVFRGVTKENAQGGAGASLWGAVDDMLG
jgi:hypothetical protein